MRSPVPSKADITQKGSILGESILNNYQNWKMNGHVWPGKGSASKLRKRADVNGEKKRNARKPLPKPHETEEEAVIRRFHDAQRMARFRAKRKQALEEAKAIERAGHAEMSLISELQRRNIAFEIANSIMCLPNSKEFQTHLYIQNSPMIVQPSSMEQTKYSQLLAVIEELGKDIRLTYAGSRTSIERLKIGIVQARMLVKDCLMETKINSQ